MINVKSFCYAPLTGNTDLVTLLGGTDHIASAYPEIVPRFPFLAFTDDAQADTEYADNKPNASDVSIKIDIFSKDVKGFPTTWEIGAVVYGIFTALDFHCGTDGEVSDPDSGVRHRVMRFSREVVSS